MSRRSAPFLFMVVGLALIAPSTPFAAADQETLSSRLDMLAGKDLRSATPEEQADATSLLTEGPGSLLRDGGSLVVDVRVGGDANDRVTGLKGAGATIVAVGADYGLITVSIPEGRLGELSNAPGVEAVTEVLTPMTGGIDAGDATESASAGAINTCATGVVSEGDAQLKSGAARTQFDVDGTGIKVGVMSDSFNHRATAPQQANDVASGDLPGPGNPCGRTTPVQVLDDSNGATADEGRAMAQIVHDIAPGANLAFATAINSEVSFANNIQALADAGSDVIVDDIIFFAEPYYQDGIVANAVNSVTADEGVAYFSMAFNNNRLIGGNDSNSWEAPAYRPTTCPAAVAVIGADCMDFNAAAGVDSTFNVTAPGGKQFRFGLQWAEPQQGVGTNFDLFVVNQASAQVFSSVDDNAVTGKPFEFVSLTANNTTALNYQVIVRRTSGTGTPRLKWVNNDNGSGSIAALEYPTSSGGDVIGPTIFGHNGTTGAQTVGAVPFNNSNAIQPYSSRGPVTHLFGPVNGATPAPALGTARVLSKPDVAATDGGINTFFGSANRFFGTSAAAPHAAGVGALQLEANPSLTQAQVKAAQKSTADPVGAFGSLAAGSGLVDAQAAIAANPTPPPTVTITTMPPDPTNDSTPNLEFTTTGDLAGSTCKVDSGPAQACSGTFTPAPLGDGDHQVTVTATDHFGQSDSDAAAFKVDTKKPKAKIKKAPKKKTTKRKAKFTFSAEAGSTFTCKLDKAKAKACKKKAKFKVKPGKHKLTVQATDSAGNKGKAVTYRWKVTK